MSERERGYPASVLPDVEKRPLTADEGHLIRAPLIKQALDAELAAAREALKPFADLRVTRFMTGGLRYNFRVDAAWIRKAKTVGGMED